MERYRLPPIHDVPDEVKTTSAAWSSRLSGRWRDAAPPRGWLAIFPDP